MSEGRPDEGAGLPQQMSVWLPFAAEAAPLWPAAADPSTEQQPSGTSSRSFTQSPVGIDAGNPWGHPLLREPRGYSSSPSSEPHASLFPSHVPSYRGSPTGGGEPETRGSSRHSNARASRLFRERRKERERVLRETVTQLAARNTELEDLLLLHGILPPPRATLQEELPIHISQRTGGPPINLPGLTYRHSETDLAALRSPVNAEHVARSQARYEARTEASSSQSSSSHGFKSTQTASLTAGRRRIAATDEDTGSGQSGSEVQRMGGAGMGPTDVPSHREPGSHFGKASLQISALPALPPPTAHCPVGDTPVTLAPLAPPLTNDFLNLQRLLFGGQTYDGSGQSQPTTAAGGQSTDPSSRAGSSCRLSDPYRQQHATASGSRSGSGAQAGPSSHGGHSVPAGYSPGAFRYATRHSYRSPIARPRPPPPPPRGRSLSTSHVSSSRQSSSTTSQRASDDVSSLLFGNPSNRSMESISEQPSRSASKMSLSQLATEAGPAPLQAPRPMQKPEQETMRSARSPKWLRPYQQPTRGGTAPPTPVDQLEQLGWTSHWPRWQQPAEVAEVRLFSSRADASQPAPGAARSAL
ncbi:hypothetical protein ACQY0O_003611 [Thecaphora frezii]